MHKVAVMQQAPAKCLLCNRGNIADDPDTMDDMWFLDLERDVNWGDPTYLCKYCCEKVGVMAGLVGMQELSEAQDLNKALRKRIHQLEADRDVKNRRLEAIGRGKQAVRQVKKERERAELDKLRTKTTTKKKAKKKVALTDD